MSTSGRRTLVPSSTSSREAADTINRDVAQLRWGGPPLVEEGGRWKATLASQGKAFPSQAPEVFSLLLFEDGVSATSAGALGSLLHDLHQRLMASLIDAARGVVEERELEAELRRSGG